MNIIVTVTARYAPPDDREIGATMWVVHGLTLCEATNVLSPYVKAMQAAGLDRLEASAYCSLPTSEAP